MNEEIIVDMVANEPAEYYNKKAIQKLIYKYIVRQKAGCIGGITGRPNFGKSWFANKIILDWYGKKLVLRVAPDKMVESYLSYDVDSIFRKTFENIRINGKALSKEEFDKIGDIKAWCRDNITSITVKPGSAILVDEAGTSVYNRDFFSAENKAMSKLVQVWRFMRMLVIFVVPERVEFLEKTLREFFDFRIEMKKKNIDEGYCEAVIYERKGRNYKGEPIFARVRGCRFGGRIKVRPLDKNYPIHAEEYEKRSKIYKTSLMMQSWRDVGEANGTTMKQETRTKDITDILKQARENKESIQVINKKNRQTMYSIEKIQGLFGVGMPTAKRIRTLMEESDEKEKTFKQVNQ